MNKTLFEIDNSERERILEMHQGATKKQYLSEQKKPTIQQTIESTLTGYDSEIPEFLNLVVQNKGKTNIKLTETGILFFYSKEETNVGTLRTFTVQPFNGLPILVEGVRFDNRLGTNWKESSPKDIIKPVNTVNDVWRDAGNNNEIKLNTIWNTEFVVNNLPDKSVFQDIINNAIQYVQKNQALFKTEFHKITRSEYAIKTWWNESSSPITFNRSQYYTMFIKKVVGNAKTVLDIIQDSELIEHIMYKVKYWRSNNNYTELKANIPKPI